MANQEQFDILKQGVDVWNAWRKEHPEIRPDLSMAQLSGANLSRANLGGAGLAATNFTDADLTGADLSWTFSSRTNFSQAGLSWANFYAAHLPGADLSGANLGVTNLTSTYLAEANLSRTRLIATVFGQVDLRLVKGLDTVDHEGPSVIGIDTIIYSRGQIPEVFLKGAGVPETFITYARSLVNNSIEYYTCFISYSSKDEDFAQHLYNDLQGNNVRCWYAPEDLKIGDKFRARIDESIRIYDKLLLILSEHSVRSPWVETEVETAFSKEHKTGKLTLFPVKLDNTVEETGEAWAATIHRTRHIGDFTRWKEHDEYQKGLNRLLRDLKQEAIHDTIESDANKDKKQSTNREIQSS